jgi:hypothetical protein
MAMPVGGLTADQNRRLVAQFSARLIERYGPRALDEAHSVITMLQEIGRDELIPLWRSTAAEIARRLKRRQARSKAA